MTTDLVQRLRICSAEERKAVAIELAKTRSEEIITELKRMIEGRHRKDLRWYNYDDQLVGIEALGETGTSGALEFLSRVYSSIIVRNYGDERHLESEESDSFTFPWARKKLGRRLVYSVELGEWEADLNFIENRVNRSGVVADLIEIFDREPHRTIQRAIRELETSTGERAQIVTIDGWSFYDLRKLRYNLRNKEQLVVEYLQGKYESSRQSNERHSPQAFLRR